MKEYMRGRRLAIQANIDAEILAGNTVKEQCERTALAEITALENLIATGEIRQCSDSELNAVLADVRAALKDLEDYIRGDTIEIIVSGNDGFDGQEIIRDPKSRDVVMQNIKIIFGKLSKHFS